MGFLKSWSAQPGISAVSSTPAADDDYWYSSPAIESASGVHVNTDTALSISTVFLCVTLRAKIVASLPLRMYQFDKEGNRTEAPNHPLNDLLEYQPNKWQTAWDFRSMLQMHLDLRGNAYAEIIAGPRGFADSLEPIHPDRMTKIERLTDGTIRYEFVDRDNRMRRLLQDEIMHIRSPIAPGLVGISPVSYARETIGTAVAMERHGARTFNNGARPGGVVTVPKSMSDKAFDRFKMTWRNEYSGYMNSGKVPILEEGADFKPITMSNDDAQFLASREFGVEEVARWFDTPAVLLHHSSKSTSFGTGIEAVMLAYVRNGLNPVLTAYEQAIRRDLILAPKVYAASFDTEALTQGDSKARSDYFSRLVLCGVLTRNEARNALGYNSKPGLDKPLTPTNTTTSDGMPGNGGADNKPPSGLSKSETVQ